MVKHKRQREMCGPAHRRRRVQFARRIERGEVLICPRCGLPIGADQGELSRDDWNPRIERPEHPWQPGGSQPLVDLAEMVSVTQTRAHWRRLVC